MHGYGSFTFPDGKSYEGYYYNDKKHGYGIFRWSNGKRYEGWWVDGKQHGYGILMNDKKKQYGYWKEGTRTQVFTENEVNTLMQEYQEA